MENTTSLERFYAEKSTDYYGHARKEIVPLLPPGRIQRILDVGCGRGDTLAFLKSAGRCERTYGVELFPEAADVARERLDEVFVGNVEHIDLPITTESLDVVLCLDVLEHLVDPWSTVARLAALLKPGGALIMSIPNVRHFRVVFPLLFKGRWNYADHGLMDRTHLRFFTEATAKEMLERARLDVDVVRKSGMESTSKRALNGATLGALEPLMVFQYLMRGVKRS